MLFHCFTIDPLSIGIPMGSDPAYSYFYETKWMSELNKNGLFKARKICNIFRFIDDLNSINDGGKFESNYSNIYPEELQLGKN